jgi:hypothetical protein
MFLRKLWNFAVVMLIYACTGACAAFVSGRVSAYLGLEKWSATWWLAWFLLILPLYNVLLLAFAFMFGRYESFRSRPRQLLSKLRKLTMPAATTTRDAPDSVTGLGP